MVNGVGYTNGGMASHGAVNDLWRMNYNSTAKTATWTRLQPGGAAPPPLHGSAMVHDGHNNRILMFGGDESSGTPAAYSDKLYHYNAVANTWTLLNPSGSKPSPRRGAALCYDKDNHRIWVFGGEDASGKVNDLHYLDVNSLPGTWNNVSGMTGSIPDPRMFATIGWDTIRQRLMLIGGDSSVSGPNAQLFEYLPAAAQKKWNALSIANSNLSLHENVCYSGAVWDDACGRFIHAPGARTKAQAVVMASSGPAWQFLAAPPTSGATGSTGMYDPVEQRYYVLFGDRAPGNIGTNGVRAVDFK
jgi:hypothetical protein